MDCAGFNSSACLLDLFKVLLSSALHSRRRPLPMRGREERGARLYSLPPSWAAVSLLIAVMFHTYGSAQGAPNLARLQATFSSPLALREIMASCCCRTLSASISFIRFLNGAYSPGGSPLITVSPLNYLWGTWLTHQLKLIFNMKLLKEISIW